MGVQENQQENQENKEIVKKIYLGNGQERVRPVTKEVFQTGTMCYDDIVKIPEEYLRMAKNGKRYFKWILSPYRQGANEYGHTHSLAVDTYKPDMDKQAFGK